MPAREQITGVVLAGGRGSRMGGVDKGLQVLEGKPLVQHAIERLAPQVGPLLINANRHLETYAGFGLPVVADVEADVAGFPGPLAGMLAALAHCTTPWLVSVPCDTPRFPLDLVARLAAAAEAADVEVVMPLTHDEAGAAQPQPVFCLLRRELHAPLAAFLASGRRRIEAFTATRRQVQLPFPDHAAFFNANTAEELDRLTARSPRS
jgi:molybdopterin-guanine dinucleotide biosynthesis protein A